MTLEKLNGERISVEVGHVKKVSNPHTQIKRVIPQGSNEQCYKTATSQPI